MECQSACLALSEGLEHVQVIKAGAERALEVRDLLVDLASDAGKLNAARELAALGDANRQIREAPVERTFRAL